MHVVAGGPEPCKTSLKVLNADPTLQHAHWQMHVLAVARLASCCSAVASGRKETSGKNGGRHQVHLRCTVHTDGAAHALRLYQQTSQHVAALCTNWLWVVY